MGDCAVCDCSLNESQDAVHNGIDYKSCPKCSADAGVHVFYQIEDFGYRDMGDGRNIVQSWCRACRGEVKPGIPPAYTCK